MSKAGKRRPSSGVTSSPPSQSVSAASLLRHGSDRHFQRLIFNLFIIAERIERVRLHVASRSGITGSQYTLLRAVVALRAKDDVTIGKLADALNVSSAFVAAQSGVLAQRGYINKNSDLTDRRVSRLSLTPRGERLVEHILREVRPINDLFFGGLSKAEFEALSVIITKLVESSRLAMSRLTAEQQRALLSQSDQRLYGADS